jgi:PAS domain S-box-containing protein
MQYIDSLLRDGAGTILLIGAVGIALGALILFAWQLRARAQERAMHAAMLAKAHRNELIVEASGEGIFELDAAGHVRFASPAAARMLGYTADELVGLDYRQVIAAAESEVNIADPTRPVRYTTDMRRGVGATLKRKDGRLRPVEYRLVPIVADQRTVGTLMTFADISERVRLDLMLNDMQVTAKVGAWEYLPDNDRLVWTDEVYRLHDLPVGSSLDLKRIIAGYDPADQRVVGRHWEAAIATGREFETESHLTTSRGRSLWVHIIGKAEVIDGRVRRVYGIIQDVTARRVAEQKLRETRDFFAQTLDAMPTMVTYINADEVITYCNRRATDTLAIPREQILGRNFSELVSLETYTHFHAYVRAALRGDPQSFTAATVIGGHNSEWQVHYVPERSSDGRVRGFFSVMHDLTEIKQLEARLVQAQKMEAVGQLTGGIAHDFNNLLGVVIGNLQLLERSLHDHPMQLRKVSTAMRAAVRGADLTRRLLAFSRRQQLEPEVVDLNRHVKGLDDLLKRTLGDSIEVRIVPAPDLWFTRIDPSQLENAVLNLAINARDAMPQGGRLSIDTCNRRLDAEFCREHPELQPGEYVCVQVADTGAGIPPDILKKVFEPFFTTKEPGKGSGLGLSMVHGFAKQSGGTAVINSELGHGTQVRILLPRSVDRCITRDDTGLNRILPGGSESILVVEDDADLRETTAATLVNLGYRVLQAQNADDALRTLAGSDPVDLLFTDIMMPGGMLGPALAQRARELRPGIHVLFTTGYANSGAFSSGLGVAYSDMLPKPFRAEDLALRVRSLLDREVRVA